MATRIKRYEAQVEDYDALLARIESEMGPGAELETRRFRRGSFLGLFGGKWMVEVVAILELGNEQPPADTKPGAAATVNDMVGEPDPKQDGPPEPAVPPAGRPRQVDLTADEPVGIEDAPGPAAGPEPAKDKTESGVKPAEPTRVPKATAKPAGAEARITTDALRFASQQEKGNAVEPAAEQKTPKPVPESVAGPAVEPAPAAKEQPAVDDTGGSQEISELKESISELKETIKLLAEQQKEVLARPPEPAKAPQPEDEVLKSDIGLLEARVADPVALDRSAGMQDAQRRVYDRLLDWNIRSYDAMELINNALAGTADGPLPGEDEMLKLIFRDICRNILVSEGIQLNPSPPGKVVALVGATGVGKTTTIAKLAAHFAFQNNARVSFVSLDNYRIAAAEQLRTYADIMGLDLDIVFSHDEFDQVLTERRSCDLTLVDTAGRSPTNTKQIYELREIFSAHPPDEIHLVVSASTKADDMRMLLDNFEPLSYDHVIISKLDETRSLGCLYNLSKYCQLPISYFTVGQSVPEDIRTANLSFVRTWIEQGRIT